MADPQVKRLRRANWLLVAVPLLIVVIGAWSYRWVQDDAFINFRIVANLLAGHGPVFNVGERVEAYTDPLWLFLLVGVHGALPFISLEWQSVVLGLAGTAAGVVLGGRAIQRLGEKRGDVAVIPIGLLIFSVVAGVWEFSTSGLEMGIVFFWIGLSFWLLVRTERLRVSALWCAFVVGLGTLIRPELLLMSVVFLAALYLVVASPGWKGPTSIWRRYVVPLLLAYGLPVIYQLWRMAYFALVVPNTALAKSAGSSWWSQGFYYLWNFTVPYALWVPFLLVIPLTVPRIARWWTAGDRVGVVVLLTPALAGLVDTLYVVHLGGDYITARAPAARLSLALPHGLRGPSPIAHRSRLRGRGHRCLVSRVRRIVAIQRWAWSFWPSRSVPQHRGRTVLLDRGFRQSTSNHLSRLRQVRPRWRSLQIDIGGGRTARASGTGGHRARTQTRYPRKRSCSPIAASFRPGIQPGEHRSHRLYERSPGVHLRQPLVGQSDRIAHDCVVPRSPGPREGNRTPHGWWRVSASPDSRFQLTSRRSDRSLLPDRH